MWCVCFQVKAEGVVSQVLSILLLETEWRSQHRRPCSLEFSFSLVYIPPHTCSNAFGSQIPSPASTLHTHLSPNNVPSTLRNPQSPSCVRLHILPSLNNSLSSTPGNNQTDNILSFLSFLVFSLFLMRGEWGQ